MAPNEDKRGKLHYGWVVVAVVFLCLLAAAGVRATPGVLIVPLQQSLGWSRADISLAISINIFLYGLTGPFAAACMQRFGIRRTTLAALILLAATVAASTRMSAVWQMMLGWGLAVGVGSGFIAVVLAATVVNRWFVQRRGLVMGILTASTATGQLVFLPLLAAVVSAHGWQAAAWIVAGAAAAMALLAAVLLKESPRALGLRPYGASADWSEPVAPAENPVTAAFRALGRAAKVRDFWLLAASFFVCGLSTNGLVGTHLISSCIDQGLPAVKGASLLAMMGVFDLIGTTASGWLSDRYDNRLLLFFYYGLRGLALIYLPYSGYGLGLLPFAVFYGLDWIATVPPTSRLATQIFGSRDAPMVFGWIVAAHQLGGAVAAYGAGAVREWLGSYAMAFIGAGAVCVVAALMVMTIGGREAGGERRKGSSPDISPPPLPN